MQVGPISLPKCLINTMLGLAAKFTAFTHNIMDCKVKCKCENGYCMQNAGCLGKTSWVVRGFCTGGQRFEPGPSPPVGCVCGTDPHKGAAPAPPPAGPEAGQRYSLDISKWLCSVRELVLSAAFSKALPKKLRQKQKYK